MEEKQTFTKVGGGKLDFFHLLFIWAWANLEHVPDGLGLGQSTVQ
jgi:hypothetical protein